ncbi:hypothetical protein BZG36_01026 [Bifiguratus adelaidae]|uniref:Sugar phosphate transporter domain-containing protein n=1 Tax=Bifiguratus adelaidae TaxID=1938954 RepID=A0A261Y6C2_9FUNG|nr:hypothetical protein BZG36_01026 [Bifiguratus adelaidae]
MANLEKKDDTLPAPASQRDKKDHPTHIIFFVVLFYFIISLSVVFLNKLIFSSSEYNFPYPLFVTWFQLVVALGILLIWSHLGKTKSSFALIPPYEFDIDIARRVAPLTFMYVMMLALNNLCLQYVEVTFYQVARSLSIVFNIIFTYTILGQTTSMTAMFACLIVFLGFVIGSYGEINFSWPGMFAGVGSSAFVALYGIYVKKTLGAVDNNQWRLLHYNTTLSILLLAPLVLFSGELSEIRENVYFLGEFGFWFLMVVTAISGFAVNIAMFLQIKFTSALTNTISGTAKACVQTILAAMIFRNPISGMNGLGIVLALIGSGYYSFVRYREMTSK